MDVSTVSGWVQNNEKLWDMDGLNWIPFEMGGVDIDTMDDWEEAERILSAR